MLKAILRHSLPDLLIALGLFVLPLLIFLPTTIGGKTLIPADNLYQYEPWASHRAKQGVPDTPQNALLSDLIFQNYQWKLFLRQSIDEGEIPLWQPNQFSGSPFLATGQHSALYPFSVIYYVLPLSSAFGWFTVSQLWLVGLFMYTFVRSGLRLSRLAALIAAISYQLSQFFIVATVHPMIQASAAWLPLILLMIELIIQRRAAVPERFSNYHNAASPFSTLPWVLVGAVAMGMSFLGGHAEITYYTLIISALYAGLRLLSVLYSKRSWKTTVALASFLILLAILGVGVGSAQFIPFYETAEDSFRTERSSLETVRGFALPNRHVAKWIVPNIYGNPAHHSYFDILEFETVQHDWIRTEPDGRETRITNTDFGIKNYVEGGAYVGIFALILAGLGLLTPSVYRVIFGVLGLIAALFMFGTPFYAVFYYLFPGTEQLHTPFRWVWLFTFVICVFAAYGAERLRQNPPRWLGEIITLVGALTLGGLALSRVLYDSLTQSLVERIFTGLAGANLAFPNAEAFYSYQFTNILIFGIILTSTGIAIWLARKRISIRQIPAWGMVAVMVIAIDLFLASYSFNPQADPDWLDFTPPSVAWLQSEMEAGEPFRIQAFDWGERPLIANTGWGYGLHDVRGYDSLFSLQYANYMNSITPQTGLGFNRINPIAYNQAALLTAPGWDELNVRYFITDWIIRAKEDLGVGDLSEANLALVNEWAGVRIYENLDALPRSYTISPEFVSDDMQIDFENAKILPARITDYGSSTVVGKVSLEDDAWLVLSDTYAAGWQAFIRPLDDPDASEDRLEVERINDNFRAVRLEAGEWSVRWDYSPQSFQLGAFVSFISGMLIIFLLLLWGWNTFVGESADADSGTRVIKNSLAPIILNLFNRGIDFAFAFIMLRILGPDGAGIYYYAIVIFGWFDILTNFGLNTLLTREVSRDQSRAGQYLVNTSVMRLGLAALGVPLLAGFLLLRNATVTPALDETALAAIILLYIGLIPNSISTGLSALFYAFEKAEYPAALATVSTLVKVSLGLGALLAGWGVVGLAGVSIITNLVTFGLMMRLVLPLIRGAGATLSGLSLPLMRTMGDESFPLMLNHFLATIFFKSDVILMEAINGVTIVGIYSTAYKWLDALNIIPAFFTMALLPLFSRQAHEDRNALGRNYLFGVKTLVIIALPVAVVTTFIAPALIGILGGAEFLPDGGIALQIMIWSIPLGWINSLTQYVLIALDRQRNITGAFIAGVSFNVIGNLIFLPQYSFRAAAITTIFSELVLLIGFYWLLRRDLKELNFWGTLWRPVIAAAIMLGAMLGLWGIHPIPSIIVGMLVYPALLWVLKPFSEIEMARLPAILKRG